MFEHYLTALRVAIQMGYDASHICRFDWRTCAPLDKEFCKQRLEKAIEARAPGRGHFY